MISTKNVPGTATLFTPSSSSVNMRINLLSGVSGWIPYEIERGNEAVKLNSGWSAGDRATVDKPGCSLPDMFPKICGALVEAHEEV